MTLVTAPTINNNNNNSNTTRTCPTPFALSARHVVTCRVTVLKMQKEYMSMVGNANAVAPSIIARLSVRKQTAKRPEGKLPPLDNTKFDDGISDGSNSVVVVIDTNSLIPSRKTKPKKPRVVKF
jgi:hypothetical protein